MSCVKIEKLKRDWDLSSVTQCLPGMHKAFCPTLNNNKKNKFISKREKVAAGWKNLGLE